MAPTIVALSLDAWWQPALVALSVPHAELHGELRRRSTLLWKEDPVQSGHYPLWNNLLRLDLGPLGLALAIPMMIILRVSWP